MKHNENSDFDEDLLEKNLLLSPEKKLKLMEEMRDFFWVKLPKEKKDLWEELKHIKLEDL